MAKAFEGPSDPREGHAKRLHFDQVLFIALVPMVSGMEHFEDFQRITRTWESPRRWLDQGFVPDSFRSEHPPKHTSSSEKRTNWQV